MINDFYTAFYSSTQEEIISLIKLDIDRTFQDLDLFHNNTVKELLTKTDSFC